MAAIIHQIPVGPLAVFTYIVGCPETGAAVVIDPAGEAERLVEIIEREGLSVVYILNTHGHADHVLANRQLKQLLPDPASIPIAMHDADDRFFSRKEIRIQSEKELGLPPPDPVDIRLQDGDRLAVGMLTIEVIHTPGHTPGSVCFLADGHLITGDTLFVGAVGRTDLSGGSLEILLESLEKRIIGLPEETVVWPGHDYGETPASTIGREKQENPYITDFILDP